MRTRLTWSIALVALAACGGGSTTDAGPGDLGPHDGGHDAGTTDSGTDAGATDSGTDAGATDSGDTDSGGDAGTTDSGDADLGVDAGTPDAGAPDAGPTGCFGDVDCGPGQFCQWRDGHCHSGGTCAPIPDVSTCTPGSPVCGCDGNDYTSSCEANASSISVASTGMCPTGCRTDADCSGARSYCLFADDVCGGVGTCNTVPFGIFCIMTCAPVCGCDGVTYINDCHRNVALTSLAHTGVCIGDTPPC